MSWEELTPAQQKILLYKSDKYECGIIDYLQKIYQNTTDEYIKSKLLQYKNYTVCDLCQGGRLNQSVKYVKLGGLDIIILTNMQLVEIKSFFDNLVLTSKKKFIANKLINTIESKVSYLLAVGLEYLTLSRASETLSGGEAQRIRLASQIGSGLTGVLYVLDEPSIGLHQRDNDRLLQTLRILRDLGNTVVVVEHDEATIKQADYVVDIGPMAGVHGGNVVICGKYKDILNSATSVTAKYLTGKEVIATTNNCRKQDNGFISLYNACGNNLKSITVKLPRKNFICVTGVSGSGKSTLINDTLNNILLTKLNKATNIEISPYSKIEGIECFDKVIDINQSPIGRTPRSIPATYTSVFTDIRELFAQVTLSKERGYLPGRFSFNIKGGRCASCSGTGSIQIKMHFLPDIYVKCDVCQGKRYNLETLEVLYDNKNIFDILEMTVSEAIEFFKNSSIIKRKLQALVDVGLGYIKLGQPATTLSGGEAQRVKLACELGRYSSGSSIYILDEPTTGLHFYDIHLLVKILHKFVDAGNTVIVIEHNLDLIKTADWIIDLGPEGGSKGGEVLFSGTLSNLLKKKIGYTYKYLLHYKDYIKQHSS